MTKPVPKRCLGLDGGDELADRQLPRWKMDGPSGQTFGNAYVVMIEPMPTMFDRFGQFGQCHHLLWQGDPP